MTPYRRVFWALLLPLGAGTALAVEKLATSLSVQPSAKKITDTIIGELAGMCAPEPQEQLLFVLSLALPIILAFLATVALRAMGTFRRTEPAHPLMSAAALASQLCFVWVGLKGIEVQGSTVFGYRFLSHRPLLGAILSVGLVTGFAHLYAPPKWPLRAIGQKVQKAWWLPWLLAMTWVGMFAITGVFRQEEIPRAPATVQLHLPYTMGEYAATLNGRIPLVDFYSQYQNLGGLLAWPFFKIFGVGVGTFTAAMSGITTLGFGLVFSALSRTCGSRWRALVLFVPLVAMAFYAESADSEVQIANAFNYYAVGPMRYFGMCVLAWFASFYLRTPCVTRLVAAAVVSLLVALNNLDFGLPSAIGVLGCVLLFPPRLGAWTLPRRVAVAGLAFLLTALSTLGLYCLCVRATVGEWPALTQLTAYQKAFALLGFCMMGMPKVGLHWAFYLTSVSAVIVAIFETFSSNHDHIADSRRMTNGGLAFAGLASAGPMAYYVGRSHHLVLTATFFSWGFVLVQFVHRNWQNWRDASHRPRQPGDYLLLMPFAAALGLFALLSSMVSEVPPLDKQLTRLTSKAPSSQPPDSNLVSLIQKYVPPKAGTVIVYRDAHLLALRAGVNNVFPFAHVGSLILKDQLNAVTAALAKLPTQEVYLFGSPVNELRGRLEEVGYKRIDGIGDFGVWARESR